MNSPVVNDRRKIKLEEILREGYIPFLGGRPERTTVIDRDDILNLAILLNTTTTVDAFLATL